MIKNLKASMPMPFFQYDGGNLRDPRLRKITCERNETNKKNEYIVKAQIKLRKLEEDIEPSSRPLLVLNNNDIRIGILIIPCYGQTKAVPDTHKSDWKPLRITKNICNSSNSLFLDFGVCIEEENIYGAFLKRQQAGDKILFFMHIKDEESGYELSVETNFSIFLDAGGYKMDKNTTPSTVQKLKYKKEIKSITGKEIRFEDMKYTMRPIQASEPISEEHVEPDSFPMEVEDEDHAVVEPDSSPMEVEDKDHANVEKSDTIVDTETKIFNLNDGETAGNTDPNINVAVENSDIHQRPVATTTSVANVVNDPKKEKKSYWKSPGGKNLIVLSSLSLGVFFLPSIAIIYPILF